MAAPIIVDNGYLKMNELKQFNLSSHYIRDINLNKN